VNNPTVRLYEILVPTQYNTGKPVRTRHHKEWDKVVRKIAGGLTILRPVKGQWVDRTTIYHDRLIPVRIACSKEQIEKIAKFSLTHYKQEAIMYYVLSHEVKIVKR